MLASVREKFRQIAVKTKSIDERIVSLEDTNKVLWSGVYHMVDGHTATLSEPVSAQPHGIVLVFSVYEDGVAGNHNFACRFVPKQIVAAHPGCGHTFVLGRTKFYKAATKYIYIRDTTLTGIADNTATGTGSGITYTNNNFVLRYVIGV